MERLMFNTLVLFLLLLTAPTFLFCSARGGDKGEGLSSLPKIPPEGLDELAEGEDFAEALIFDGKTEFLTALYKENELLKAPFSGRECAFWHIEAYYQTPGTNYHIGTKLADEDFYARVLDKLVSVEQAVVDFPPTLKETYKVGEEPENIREALEALGWWGAAKSYPEFTVYEWVLLPDKEYTLTIYRTGSALPPEEPEGESIYETYYHFFFK